MIDEVAYLVHESELVWTRGIAYDPGNLKTCPAGEDSTLSQKQATCSSTERRWAARSRPSSLAWTRRQMAAPWAERSSFSRPGSPASASDSDSLSSPAVRSPEPSSAP